ncbi:eEF1A lysine and N-terminal methyltransferase-like isoform X2 [Paramacrobiotus metropolitanus]|nr:eEF1A lysine and N-terminal methyltransferase-like isoform X2 [Paramacrobiotus metropolitanus]
MTKKYRESCPDMKFITDDVTKMATVSDESYTVVLDKATFDALIADDSAASGEIARKICSEVDRVLKWGGRYVCISLAQKHVLAPLVVNMAEKNYAIRAHVLNVDTSESERPNDIVFCFVFTKMKPGGALICDMQLNPREKITRVEDLHQFIKRIREHQYIQTLAKFLKLGRYDAVEGEHLKIFNEKSIHCYNLYPFKPQVKKAQFTAACFIIPPGRSKTFLYGTHEGRKEVAEQNISAQLVLFVEVIEPPNGRFSFDAVKEQLTPHLRDLMPLKLFEKMVFLTDGAFPESEKIVPGDEIVYEGSSPTTGEYRILERRLPGENDFERRLVFLDTPHVIQTEVRLKKVPPNNANKTGVEFNRDYLPSDYQRCIIASLINHKKLRDGQKIKILLIGLGGGSLTSFMHQNFPTAVIEAVEIDPAMVQIAIEFFGLIIDERCGAHVGDGIPYLKEAAQRDDRYDAIIIDADTKDSRLPLRCPPAAFLNQEMLRTMRGLVNPDGMVIINILTRKAEIADAVKNGILNVFGNVVYTLGLDDELNSTAVALHPSYFVPGPDDKLDGEYKMRSKDALEYWKEGLREFNRRMDEKDGEILLDGSLWWKRLEIIFTIPFLMGKEEYAVPESDSSSFKFKQD